MVHNDYFSWIFDIKVTRREEGEWRKEKVGSWKKFVKNMDKMR